MKPLLALLLLLGASAAAAADRPNVLFVAADDLRNDLGYSVRTERFRYTEWRDWKTGAAVARELHDHDRDPSETVNRAADPAFAGDVGRSATLLESLRRESRHAESSAGLAGASARIEPDEFPAYTRVSFRVSISVNEPISAGSVVEVQLPNSFTADQVSPSKVKAWQIADPAAPHFVAVSAGNLGPDDLEVKIRPREYVGGYSVPTRHGRCVAVRLLRGRVEKGQAITVSFRNTTSPWIANQRPGATDHEGLVLVMIDGKKVQPSPAFRVLPGPAAVSRVIVPSSARPGEAFRVQLVSLDAFNNLSSSTFHNVAISCGDTVLTEALSYTGRAAVDVALPQPGVYRLRAGDAVSNPVRICEQPSGPYWGDIHFHNYPSVDAMGNTPYEYARDVSCLDFAATTEHAAGGLAEHWAQTCRWCRQASQPGRFVTILGLESATGRWHHNLYFYEDPVPMVQAQAKGSSTIPLADLLDYLKGKRVVTEIHHTGWGFDMRLRYPDTLRLFEIYSMHGTSELYDPESPLFMDKQRNRQGDSKIGPYYARDAWALGQRFVTIGSSDNHFGQPGVRHNSLTAVAAKALTRDALLDAMVAGRCYATTGERILLEFSVNGRPMGSEFKAGLGEKLEFSIEVHGTGALGAVEVFACPLIEGNREVPVGQAMFAKEDPAVDRARNGWHTVFARTDLGEMDASHAWQEKYDGQPAVYYARVKQRDLLTLPGILEGQDKPQQRTVAAWSSPIWILPKR